MLEQWEADKLLHMPKVYTVTTTVTLTGGVDDYHPIESADGAEQFCSTCRGLAEISIKPSFSYDSIGKSCWPGCAPQGRIPIRTDKGWARLIFHSYREGDGARWAEQLEPFKNVVAALVAFCSRINLPFPDTQSPFPDEQGGI